LKTLWKTESEKLAFVPGTLFNSSSKTFQYLNQQFMQCATIWFSMLKTSYQQINNSYRIKKIIYESINYIY